MAVKSVAFKVGHEHCGVCGACFLHAAQLHRCPASVDLEVLEVFLDQIKSVPARSAFASMAGGGERENGFTDRLTESRGHRVRRNY